MTIMGKLEKLAADFGWKLQAPEVGISVMEDFVFKASPPTEKERQCLDYLVRMHKAGQCLGNPEWDRVTRYLWSKEDGWSRYDLLLGKLFSVLQSHHDALHFKACYDEVKAYTPEIDDTSEWCARGDKMFELNRQFRSSKKNSGFYLESLLLNAAQESGGSQEELLKLVSALSDKALLERIKNAWKAFGHLFRRNAPARGE